MGRKMRKIELSNLPKFLRRISQEIEEDGGRYWHCDICEMAAEEIELLQRIIVQDPVEMEGG